MKGGSKPISSPSRAAEKFPPPLMRFLRSNVGSKSSRRSKSSPMFVVRRKNAHPIETQEPSSPKVTCIGQVRVKRSSQNKNINRTNSGRRKPSPAAKSWVFCTPRIPKLSRIRRGCCKWVAFFRSGCCKSSTFREDSSKLEPNQSEFNAGESKATFADQIEDEAPQFEEPGEVFKASTPPKNAFLLTRCRSAPFRSSSLAVQFWGENDGGGGNDVELKKRCDFEEIEKELSESRSTKSENEEEEEECVIRKRLQVSINNGRSMEKVEMRPIVLTRCKSEPARTGEQLNKMIVFFFKEQGDIHRNYCGASR